MLCRLKTSGVSQPKRADTTILLPEALTWWIIESARPGMDHAKIEIPSLVESRDHESLNFHDGGDPKGRRLRLCQKVPAEAL